MKRSLIISVFVIFLFIFTSGCLDTRENEPDCKVEYGLDFNLSNLNERDYFLIREDILNISILNIDENTYFQLSISINNLSSTYNYILKITEIDNIKYYNISERSHTSNIVFPKSNQYSISIHLKFVSDELDYLINTWCNGYLNFTYQYGEEIPLEIIEYEDNILKEYIFMGHPFRSGQDSSFTINLFKGKDTADVARLFIDPYIMCLSDWYWGRLSHLLQIKWYR